MADFAGLSKLPRTALSAVGESSISELKTRPDYAVTVHNALVGFVELKAPGKGADPRKFKEGYLPLIVKEISQSRKEANRIKRDKTGVQQPVCIVLASRSAKNIADIPAND